LALVAVVENGTFSAAAEQLGYTQSAVSQQIGILERIVGAPLFERPGGRRPVQLTAAGQMLLIHARVVIARVSAAAADLRALASGEQGELRVGTLPSVGTKILPRLLGTFRAEWPGIQIVLHESRESADLIHAVESGDIDVTFIDIGPYETGLLQVRCLLDDPMVLVTPAGAPEAGRRTVSIDDVAHLPMIGTRNPGCRQIIDNAFRQAAVLPLTSSVPTTPRPSRASSAQAWPTPCCRSSQWTKTIQTWQLSPSDPSLRRAVSASHGIPTAGRQPPFCPLSRRQPKYVATSVSSGRRRVPRDRR